MLSKKIKNLRESKHYSLRDLGEKSGLAFNTIAKYERGDAVPRGRSMEKLAVALGVTINDLTGDSPIRLTDGPFDAKKFERSLSEARLLDEDTKTLLNVIIEEFVEKKKLKDFYSGLGELSKKLV